MHGLHLSETQQDAVFGILHAREPALRDQFKAVRSSRDALRKAALTSGTEAEQLRLLGDAAGKADADLAVLMAQTDQRLLQLLTADQQRALQDCLAR
jgi:Spy/CpxP family protein refolding chaperone